MSVLHLILFSLIFIQKCIVEITTNSAISLLKNLRNDNRRNLFTSATLSFNTIYSYSTNCKYGRVAILSSSTYIFVHIETGPVFADVFTIYAADTSLTTTSKLEDSTVTGTYNNGNYANFVYIGSNKILAFHSPNILTVFSYTSSFSLIQTSSINYFGSVPLTDYEVVDSVLLTGATSYVGVMVWEYR
jgi:hypothetical protein